MAKQSKEQKLAKKWWMRFVVAAILLGLAYGFASVAIDSGSWLAYGLTFFFVGWGIKQAVSGGHRLFLTVRK